MFIDSEQQEEIKKQCFKCGKNKLISKFYRHPRMKDGHLNKCKECTKKDARNVRAENVEYYRAYDKERNSSTQRKERLIKNTKKYRKANPVVYKSQSAVSNAVRDKRLFKQPCFICGSDNVHGHHYDYSKPLSVIWLCPEHHSWMHSKIKVVAVL